jgi:hypothetical protein
VQAGEPGVGEKVPALHTMQPDAPGGEVKPAGHAWQDVAPGLKVNVPAGHCWQGCMPVGLNCPRGHCCARADAAPSHTTQATTTKTIDRHPPNRIDASGQQAARHAKPPGNAARARAPRSDFRSAPPTIGLFSILETRDRGLSKVAPAGVAPREVTVPEGQRLDDRVAGCSRVLRVVRLLRFAAADVPASRADAQVEIRPALLAAIGEWRVDRTVEVRA